MYEPQYLESTTCLQDYGGYIGVQLLHNGLLQLCL